MSEGLCQHCISGVRHKGTPEGKVEKIGGVDCYVATPSGAYDESKVLVVCTGVFGISFIDSQLLADDFARNGYRTVVPDYLNNDPVPEDAFDAPGRYDLSSWLRAHGEDVWKPVMDALVATLKAGGVARIATASVATAIAHPSLLKPEHLERYRDESKAPLLINGCEIDPAFPRDLQAKADEIFKDFAPGYERLYWEGCTHGFAERADFNHSKSKAGKEGAFEATVKFLDRYL
ncbi:hypothetical protein DAEQUDRAFT_764368 [Daedalea quercina L-15889]|uniref:Dienelactone hydrolase domain-containing protein n=1 Tax=Daedalea quercina L-15889 TaxID=1314783 RepID=A0A165RIK9_9APHY|nr:hypothetical protein DAEQUDRAFT_764368 [Daedalea quercina L-15889]